MSNRATTSGKGYEKIVADIYRQFSGVAEVTENEYVVGKSGRKRQIDVALRTEIAGNPLLVVIECKDYTRAVGIDKVDELVGKIDDVGAQMGVLVSDSGFDAGAVGRAKSSDRIRLASVLDAENSLLRAKLKLAVSVAFFELQSPRFSIVADFPLNDGEILAIFRQEQTNIEQGFYAWYAAASSDIEAGEHEHQQTITLAENKNIIATTAFKQSIRVFFKENVWDKGTGIYDAIEKKVVKGDEFQGVFLDFPHIKANWREITGNEDKEKVNVEYRLIHTYGNSPTN